MNYGQSRVLWGYAGREDIVNTNVLILPGIGDSGPGHWQTWWERSNPSFRRVRQRDWDTPLCSDWVESLELAVAGSGPETVLIAHSLACLLVVHWAASSKLSVRGAMLVAVPDPASPCFPDGSREFAPFPCTRLPFPSVIVASGNDVYASPEFSSKCAGQWGSRLISLGDVGHINADSGFGPWPDGLEILQGLLG